MKKIYTREEEIFISDFISSMVNNAHFNEEGVENKTTENLTVRFGDFDDIASQNISFDLLRKLVTMIEKMETYDELDIIGYMFYTGNGIDQTYIEAAVDTYNNNKENLDYLSFLNTICIKYKNIIKKYADFVIIPEDRKQYIESIMKEFRSVMQKELNYTINEQSNYQKKLK